jgi:hypothetical protein
MNGEITPPAAALTIEQCDDLLTTGMCNIRDAILGYTEHGLTQDQISDRVTSLGFKASVRTIQRHVTDLRKEGLLKPVEPGTSRWTEQRRRKADGATRQFGGMHQPYQEPPQPTVLNPSLNENNLAPAASQYCLQAKSDNKVIFPDVLTLSDAELDFQRAEQLLEELYQLTKKNFATEWTKLQWNTVGGECRTIADCCDARGGRKCSASKQIVSDGGAFSHGSS